MSSDIERLEKQILELQKKIADKDKQIASIKNEPEDSEKSDRSKRHKTDESDMMDKLIALQSNFPKEWKEITNCLKKVYLHSKNDNTKRVSFQMSLLGILWSDIAAIPEVLAINNRITSVELGRKTVDFSSVDEGPWTNEFDEQARAEIIDWAKQFCLSPFVKPESLISSNLWGYIIRKMFLTLENRCSRLPKSSKLQVFSEFSAKNITALNAKFYTDYAVMAGCKGVPLLLAELESRELFQKSKGNRSRHKDLKKLAVQMGSVLLELIGMVKEANMQIEISDLRIFGNLIIDTKIHCVCSRPLKFPENKFAIVFESGPILELFDLDTKKNVSPSDSDSDSDLGPVSDSESFDLTVEIEQETNDYELAFEAELKKKNIQFPTSSLDRDYSEPLGPVNMESLQALAFFLGKIHDYYSSLDESLLDLYTKPHEFKKDPNLIYPVKAGGFSPQLSCAQLHSFIKTLSYTNSRDEIDIPTHFIFSTLPMIVHIQPSDFDQRTQIVRYAECMSLHEVEHSIIKDEEFIDLDLNRSYHRSALILDIVMGLYMASKSGIGFDTFNIDDMTFRNGLYCIKTFANCKPISADFTVIDCVDKFHSFYCTIFLMDRIMMEDDPKYVNYNNIESIILGRTRNLRRRKQEMSKEDWIEMFKEAKVEFQEILDELMCSYETESTWFLLNNLKSTLEAQTSSDS